MTISIKLYPDLLDIPDELLTETGREAKRRQLAERRPPLTREDVEQMLAPAEAEVKP